MFSTKWIFLCTVVAILSATTSSPAPNAYKEYDLARTKVNTEDSEESEPLPVGSLSSTEKVEYKTLRPGLAESLVGYVEFN